MANKFLSILETIGKDALKGFQIAEPIVQTFVPAAAPLLATLENVINAYEKNGTPLTGNTLEQVIQALATSSAILQHATSIGGTPVVPPSVITIPPPTGAA
jgi:hypothetical protein